MASFKHEHNRLSLVEMVEMLWDSYIGGTIPEGFIVVDEESEAERESAEKLRKASELARGTAETSRQEHEVLRQQFESVRKTNEVERIDLYNKMKSLFDKYRFGTGDSSMVSDIYGEHIKGNDFMTIYFVFSDGRKISFNIPYSGVDTASSFVRYAASSSGTERPAEEEFQSTIPDVEQGHYLWTWTHMEFSDGKSLDTYSVSRVGIDGKGIKESKIYYSQKSSPVDPTTITDWGDFPTSLIEGYWLYIKTVITYSEGSTTISYSAVKNGTGSFYAGLEEYYAPCASGSAAPDGYPTPGKYVDGQEVVISGDWKEERPSESVLYAKPFIWNFEISYDSAGNKYVTTPICIGNFAKGIASIVETYAISAYGKPNGTGRYPTDISEWTDEQQDAAPTVAKPFQWNKTVTTYNDLTSEEHYHVSAVRGGDSFSVDITTSTGTFVIDKDATNTLIATVRQGGEDITESLDAYQFSWLRISEDTVGDALWNSKHKGAGRSITIGNSDIVRKAVFECEVDI